jgi:menaquinone-dependent protoporphyrinogen IX oxidase
MSRELAKKFLCLPDFPDKKLDENIKYKHEEALFYSSFLSRLSVRFRDELKNKPVAYFIVCLTMYENSEESRAKAQEYLKPLLKTKQPISIGLFGGKMDYSKLSFIWRILFKGRIPEGDFRNWDLIEEWAKNLGEELKNKV